MFSPDEEKALEIGFDVALRPVNDALANITGPSSKTIGRMLNAMLCTQVRNVVKVYGRAAEMLNKAGIPLGPVPLKLLKPILDGASMEEDEYLQETWAALLANSSIDDQKVHPTFPDILRQLSAADVRFLESVWHKIVRSATRGGTYLEEPIMRDFGLGEFGSIQSEYKHLVKGSDTSESSSGVLDAAGMWAARKEWEKTAADLGLILANLLRLGLIAANTTTQTKRGQKLEIRMTGELKTDEIDLETKKEFALTAFGIRFLKMCQPPEA